MTEPFRDLVDGHAPFPLVRKERRPLWQWVVLSGLLYVWMVAVWEVCA